MLSSYVDKIAERIQFLKRTAGLHGLFYPPEWHRLKPWFTSGAMTPIKYWLIAIPFITGLVSIFPIEIVAGEIELSFGGDFSPPFSFFLSYCAAIAYMCAFAIFKIRCPRFVADKPPKFDGIPADTTRLEIANTIRNYIISCLPNVISASQKYVRTPEGFYNTIDQGEGNSVGLSSNDFKEIEEIWTNNASYTQKEVLRTSRDKIFFYEPEGEERLARTDDFGGRDTVFDQILEDDHLLALVFFPNVGIIQSKDDHIAVKAYTSLYFALSESRAVSRLLARALLVVSSVLGLIVLVQIILRGFAILLSF